MSSFDLRTLEEQAQAAAGSALRVKKRSERPRHSKITTGRAGGRESGLNWSPTADRGLDPRPTATAASITEGSYGFDPAGPRPIRRRLALRPKTRPLFVNPVQFSILICPYIARIVGINRYALCRHL